MNSTEDIQQPDDVSSSRVRRQMMRALIYSTVLLSMFGFFASDPSFTGDVLEIPAKCPSCRA